MTSKPKILLLYKNSTYAGYFLNSQRRFSQLQGLFNSEEIKRFRKTHEAHFWALSYVEAVLKNKGLKYTKICRGTSVNYNSYNFIITFGGDGTFLEAARNVKKQLIWGVNSDPTWSVGRFCSGHPINFQTMLEGILNGQFNTKTFHRLQLQFNHGVQSMHVLNDILICHQSPGAMSRYYLKFGKAKEEQKSSGVWVSTAAGSTGGIYSAGGKALNDQSPLMQFLPRELYRGTGTSYKLKGSVIKPTQKLSVTSLMREGVIFVDGSHICLPFSFGTTVKIAKSPHPLKVIWS
jgi:NAD+ kinase